MAHEHAAENPGPGGLNLSKSEPLARAPVSNCRAVTVIVVTKRTASERNTWRGRVLQSRAVAGARRACTLSGGFFWSCRELVSAAAWFIAPAAVVDEGAQASGEPVGLGEVDEVSPV